MSSSCQSKILALKSAIVLRTPTLRAGSQFRIPKSALDNVLVFLANVGILAKNFCAVDKIIAAVR